MKKRILFLVILGTLFFPQISAHAAVEHGYNEAYIDKCVNDKTCLLLCGYENKTQYTMKGIEPVGYDYNSSYIYYYFDTQKIAITWIGDETELKYATESYKNAKNKHIFWQKSAYSNLTNYGDCPLNSYIDRDTTNGANEACFDSDSKYCKGDPGGWFTSFKGESTIKYDYNNDVAIYFKNWSPTITSCDELRSQSFDIKSTIETDFSTNFLYKNVIPYFIKNSKEYQDGFKTIEQKYTDQKNACDTEVQNQYAAGLINEAQKNKNLEQNKDGLNKALSQVSQAKQQIEVGSSETVVDLTTGKPIDCSEFTDDEGTNIISEIFNIIMIVAPILALVLGGVDFAKASLQSDESALKKAGINFGKRIGAAVLLFLLPLILNLILGIAFDAGIFGSSEVPELCLDSEK